MTSDTEAQNFKNTTVTSIPHLGPHFTILGVFVILKGQTGETDLGLTKEKQAYSLQKNPKLQT